MAPSLPSPANLAEQLPDEWETTLKAWGEPRYRALQIFRWIHQRGVCNPAQMTDLPKRLRDRLTQEGLSPAAAVADTHNSDDGTKKLVIELGDGKRIETVLIPRASVAAEDVYAEGCPAAVLQQQADEYAELFRQVGS